MRLCIGHYMVSSREYGSRGEWEEQGRIQGASNLFEEEYARRYYAVEVRSSLNGDLHAVLTFACDWHGAEPGYVFYGENQIVLGCNRLLTGINVRERALAWRIGLESIFRSFMSDQSGTVALYETGVVAFEPSGRKKWEFSRDIVVDAKRDGNRLILSFMDSPSAVLDLATGQLSG